MNTLNCSLIDAQMATTIMGLYAKLAGQQELLMLKTAIAQLLLAKKPCEILSLGLQAQETAEALRQEANELCHSMLPNVAHAVPQRAWAAKVIQRGLLAHDLSTPTLLNMAGYTTRHHWEELLEFRAAVWRFAAHVHAEDILKGADVSEDLDNDRGLLLANDNLMTLVLDVVSEALDLFGLRDHTLFCTQMGKGAWDLYRMAANVIVGTHPWVMRRLRVTDSTRRAVRNFIGKRAFVDYLETDVFYILRAAREVLVSCPPVLSGETDIMSGSLRLCEVIFQKGMIADPDRILSNTSLPDRHELSQPIPEADKAFFGEAILRRYVASQLALISNNKEV